MSWESNITFIGSNGANSDLDMGTGAVTLTGNRTVTVQNAATTFTVGGVIGDGASSYGLTKDGAGTLVLTGANAYDGDTTVAGGTLSLGTATLADGSVVTVDTGATLNLNFAETDDIFMLFLGGSPAAGGTWAADGTVGVDHTSPLLTGAGILNSAGGIYNDGRFYWDGGDVNIASDGDGASAGGAGTWSTSISNWDKGFTAHQDWHNTTDDRAIFKTAGGTVTLGSDITLGEMEVSEARYYFGPTDETHTLNLGGAVNKITIDGQYATFRCGITGSPTIDNTGKAGDNNSALDLSPTADVTMTIGAINLHKNASNSKNQVLILGGAGNGNTIASINYSSSPYVLTINKQGAGTWQVGDINSNRSSLNVKGGTLIVTGNVTLGDQQAYVQNGGTLAGTGNYQLQNSGKVIQVQNGGTVAPGVGVGQMTVTTGKLQLQAGSTYEWEVGNGATDTIHIGATATTDLGDFTLKIFDLGGAAPSQMPVFTYDAGVTVDLSGFLDKFNTDDLAGKGWTIGSLALSVVEAGDTSGTIYLTGLSKGTAGDVTGDGVVDAADYILLKQNWGNSSGSSADAAACDLDGSGTVGIGDLDMLATALNNAAAGAVTPEPATLALLAFGGLAVIRRKRR